MNSYTFKLTEHEFRALKEAMEVFKHYKYDDLFDMVTKRDFNRALAKIKNTTEDE